MKKANLYFLSLLTIIFGIILIECISYLSLSSDEKKIPIESLVYASKNEFISNLALESGCSWANTTITHSMLGFVHRQPDYLPSECKNSIHINNIGIQSIRDLPLYKNINEFAILVIGGSVAQQFSEYLDTNNQYFFESYLNKNFISPNAKPFKIYTGALGGWAMPNQVVMLQMYGERVDAIVAIDGYNESFSVQEGLRTEQISPVNQIIASSSYHGFNHFYLDGLILFKKILIKTPLKYSYFFNLAYKGFSGFFQHVIINEVLRSEFMNGNNEKINLPIEQARAWSLTSLGKYIKLLHDISKTYSIKSAQFLQPTRLYGKKLNKSEKIHQEFINVETYRSIENLYLKLASQNYPIDSLTSIFQNETKDIFSDHIHFILDKNKYSYGNEVLAREIANRLQKMWKLKRK